MNKFLINIMVCLGMYCGGFFGMFPPESRQSGLKDDFDLLSRAFASQTRVAWAEVPARQQPSRSASSGFFAPRSRQVGPEVVHPEEDSQLSTRGAQRKLIGIYEEHNTELYKCAQSLAKQLEDKDYQIQVDKQTLSILAEQLTGARQQLKEANLEKQTLRVELEYQNKKAEEMRVFIEDILTENDFFKERISEMERYKTNADQENMLLKRRIQALQEKLKDEFFIQEIQRRYNELREILEGKNKSLKAKNASLEQRIQTLEQQVEAFKSSKIPVIEGHSSSSTGSQSLGSGSLSSRSSESTVVDLAHFQDDPDNPRNGAALIRQSLAAQGPFTEDQLSEAPTFTSEDWDSNQ